MLNFKNKMEDISNIQSTYKPKCLNLRFELEKALQDLEPGMIYSRSPSDKMFNSARKNAFKENINIDMRALILLKEKEISDAKFKCVKLEAENEKYKKKLIKRENVNQLYQQENTANLTNQITKMNELIMALEKENSTLQNKHKQAYTEMQRVYTLQD
jgi:hypothetical protein